MSDQKADPAPTRLEVIAPNLKRRLSGVTSTIARLVPIQAKSIAIRATGPGLPSGTPHISLFQVLFLRRKELRLWHARRNVEMLLGLFLSRVLRKRLILVFTSASQRHHTGLTKWLISQMDEVISTSAKTARFLERPSHVIHHGIDAEAFRPATDRAGLRRDLGLPEGLLIGCIGRIRHQKGTDLFVDAMIRVLPDHPNATAIILGRATDAHTDFLDDLKARVAKAGLSTQIRFQAEVPVDQVVKWYSALDLFVAPQRWEGFGLTPLEAMACAVPVVATDVGAFEEIIDDGNTGILIARDDIRAMVSGTQQYLNNPDKVSADGIAARAWVQSHFTLENEAARIVALYRSVLDASIYQHWRRRNVIIELAQKTVFWFTRSFLPDRLRLRFPGPDELLHQVSGKTVALVGNARSLAQTTFGAEIEQADQIIRMNRAPRASIESHGFRTDWLALATGLKFGRARQIRPERIMWMSHKIKRLPYWATQTTGMSVHPKTAWESLGRELRAPPSTGLMMIALLAQSDATEVHLYGFDFFASLSLTGSRTEAQVPHDFAAERDFVIALLQTDPRFTLHAAPKPA